VYLFLISFLSIYGAVHVYAFVKIRAAFPLGAAAGFALGLFMAVMTCSPVLVRVMERHGFELLPRLLSYIGYTWMGLLFLFFSGSLLMDLYRLIVYISGHILSRDMSLLMPSARISFVIPFILSMCISVYGYFEALNIKAEKITITSPKIPAEMGHLRIVQISDVHLGLIVRQGRLERIMKVIKDASPDILVSSGDLVDGQINALTGLPEILHEIQPRYGKYAVTGNHEFYAGLPHALEIIDSAGFSILRGEAVTIPGVINIAGLDDPTGKRFGLAQGASEEELLSSLPKDTFTILLKHLPIVRKNKPGLFDLQLSGHTHRGQIFPFSLVIRHFFTHTSGLYNLTENSHLYVSRGTGTWGPPIRFLSPPEVTVIDLFHESRQSQR
jgi:predicted MPP superfamily phosphohydrolase